MIKILEKISEFRSFFVIHRSELLPMPPEGPTIYSSNIIFVKMWKNHEKGVSLTFMFGSIGDVRKAIR